MTHFYLRINYTYPSTYDITQNIGNPEKLGGGKKPTPMIGMMTMKLNLDKTGRVFLGVYIGE